jgi:hypothetical protein
MPTKSFAKFFAVFGKIIYLRMTFTFKNIKKHVLTFAYISVLATYNTLQIIYI